MSNFAKHFTNMFAENASKSAYSSCGAVNFNIADFADTVLAVSVLLCSLIAIINLTLLGLIDIIILAGIILINLICLKKIIDKKRNANIPAMD